MQQPPNPHLQNRQFLPPSPQLQQQPDYTQPQTYYPPQQPPLPPKKRMRRTDKFVLAVIGAVVSIFILAIIIAIANTSAAHNLNATATANADNLTATAIANNATVSAGLTAITSDQAQTAMTPTPVPTLPPAQSEATYKASTTNTSIEALDKDGNADQGKDVHFTCTILDFVKDSNGNTAGANVDDPNTSGVVQIAFPTNTDLSRLNTGDTLEVWGTDEGTQSGQNAFGATIQEVVVSANYMTDKTTNYQANG
jgi:hypothetical protein